MIVALKQELLKKEQSLLELKGSVNKMEETLNLYLANKELINKSTQCDF